MSLRIALFLVVLVPAIFGITGWVAHRAGEAIGLARRGRWRLAVGVWLCVLVPTALRLTHVLTDTVVVAMFALGVGLTCLLAFPPMLLVQVVDAIARRVARRREAKAEEASTSSPPRSVAASKSVSSTEPILEPKSPSITESIPESKSVSITRSITSNGASEEDRVEPISRREAIRRAGIGASVLVGGGSSVYGMTFGRHDYVLEEVPVTLSRLPRTLDGYTIAQISDIHVGAFVGEAELRAAEALIRRARPDLIVMTGDLIDHDLRYAPRLGELVRRLEQLGARDGVVAIAGNHEYYAGVDDVLATVREAGARILRNDGVLVPDGERASAAEVTRGFSLLGVDDIWARRYGNTGGADLPRTLGFARPEQAHVLLCHNPELFEQAAGQIDLQLSGHTHGGQVTFLVRPADLVLRHGFVMGRYQREGSQLYVNRGFGTAGPPIRIGTPPEISRIVLSSG